MRCRCLLQVVDLDGLHEAGAEIDVPDAQVASLVEAGAIEVLGKADPPKADPPKADPPKADPPKADPPKADPPDEPTPKPKKRSR